jgi:parvulin-like peptidyl-prolyl isomerase
MTYRAKPVVRPGRSFLDRPDRRNFLLNLGFGLVVAVAVLVLLLAAALSWYDQHLAPVASVDGQGITKDDLNRRYEVEVARMAIAQNRVRDEFNAGRLTAEQRDAQLQFLAQRQDQLPAIALERLIDARVQAALATQEGLTISEADVEARIAEEATRPEQRYVWVMEVAPAVEDGAKEPTAAAKAEAKGRAETVLKDLRGGKSWDDVAKELSAGAGASSPDGSNELGWVTDSFDPNEAFTKAVFALDKDAVSDVFVDEDGTAKIGRVTDIVAETVESDYPALMVARGVSREDYQAAIRQDLPGQKLRDQIEQAALAAGPQREVREIYLENTSLPEPPATGAVKARHILIAPKDDPQGASTLAADDPAWKAAETEARKLYDEVKAAPSTFDARAREASDEGGADVSGGKLPWFDPSMSEGGQIDKAFGDALFAPGLQPGQILEPVRSTFGWHVIQIMYTISDEEQARKLKEQIADGAKFADLARDYSAGPEATEGGERGWIARYQLDPASEKAIFETPVGQVSEPVVVDGDGVHLYLVEAEETRTPEGAQKQELEQSAFSNWYQAKKESFQIDRDPNFAGPIG